MQQFIQQLINGLSSGAIYALIAVGYTMVYGVLRLINFAHGDVYMVGAMMGLYVGTGKFSLTGVSWWAQPALWLAMWMVAFGIIRAARFTVPAWLVVAGQVIVAAAVSTTIAHLASLVFKVDKPGDVLPAWWITFPAAMIASMVVCGCLGYVIELLAYRPLRNQPRITSLITAIGVSLLLMNGGQKVFGVNPQGFPYKSIMPLIDRHPLLIDHGGLTLGTADAIIIVATILLMLALTYVVLYTRTGLALRAVSHRFDTASLMGININRIVSFTFVLGSVLAAAAGVLIALRSPKVEPLMGLMMGLKAFVAAVLGGIGNIAGAVAGGVLLGLTEALVKGYFPQGSQYAEGVAFVILIGVLLLKPSGLLGKNVIEKV